MNNVDSAQQRESNHSYESYNESNKESYKKYGRSSLPGENTANRENGNADEAAYDRYDYEGAETPDQQIRHYLDLVFHPQFTHCSKIYLES